jgi:hypothetical protein
VFRFPSPRWRRIDPEELMAVQAATAAPPRARDGRPVPGALVMDGPNVRRHTDALPQPPRRERPPDLEANAVGRALYGPRQRGDHALVGPLSRSPASVAGTKLSYRPLEGRTARVDGIRVNRTGAAAALAYEVQLLRGGRTHPLYTVGDADLTVEAPITLQGGDELRVEVTTATGANVDLVSHFSVAELGS